MKNFDPKLFYGQIDITCIESHFKCACISLFVNLGLGVRLFGHSPVNQLVPLWSVLREIEMKGLSVGLCVFR